jgi:hypothetical protein
MVRLVAVKALAPYRIWLKYDNGVEGVVDVSEYAGKGVFALWNDPAAFHDVHLGSSGEVIWGDSVDLCPDALYVKLTGQRPEDLFPKLRELAEHARD